MRGQQVEVYFDDFEVTQAKSPVVQTDDYYQFGLTFNSYRRENSVENRYKFQGQEHVDDLELGWDSFKWRNHQPAAQDQLEGIQGAQQSAKKAKKGEKQNRVNSTKKSEQRLDNLLDRIDNLDDLE